MGKKINYRKLHELCFLDREHLFGGLSNFEKFSTKLGEIEKDPFIGFIGKRYEETKVRVLFLGKSNAESIKPYHQDKDLRINTFFKEFKECKENFEARYRAYAKEYSDKPNGAFWSWDINRYPIYFRNNTRLDVEEIAYANIVPFRYKGAPSNANRDKTYEISFKNFTNKFISIIQPDQIIPLGSNLDIKIVNKHLKAGHLIKVSNGIFRRRGDKSIPPEGYETLDSAIEDFKELLSKV